jgi:hypothetical protein
MNGLVSVVQRSEREFGDRLGEENRRSGHQAGAHSRRGAIPGGLAPIAWAEFGVVDVKGGGGVIVPVTVLVSTLWGG